MSNLIQGKLDDLEEQKEGQAYDSYKDNLSPQYAELKKRAQELARINSIDLEMSSSDEFIEVAPQNNQDIALKLLKAGNEQKPTILSNVYDRE